VHYNVVAPPNANVTDVRKDNEPFGFVMLFFRPGFDVMYSIFNMQIV